MLHTLEGDLKKAEQHLHDEFAKLQVGRANPAIVEGITVMVYGSAQPLRNVASVGTLDAQTISIQPWDKSVLRDISKAINDANIGLNPQDNGESVLIRIPALTEERRRDLVKIAKRLTEEGKVTVRNIRQDYLKKIKSQDESVSEDIVKQQENELQKKIDGQKIDQMDGYKEEKNCEYPVPQYGKKGLEPMHNPDTFTPRLDWPEKNTKDNLRMPNYKQASAPAVAAPAAPAAPKPQPPPVQP